MPMLSAQSVVEVGGETEFADMRAAFEDLPTERRLLIEDLIAGHMKAQD